MWRRVMEGPESHLRRSAVHFLFLPALPGWPSFCRASGAEVKNSVRRGEFSEDGARICDVNEPPRRRRYKEKPGIA
jgi:hypothetical protein